MNTLVGRHSYTVEHIYQAADLLTYIRLVQQLTVTSQPQDLGHPATALLEDYTANSFPVKVGQ